MLGKEGQDGDRLKDLTGRKGEGRGKKREKENYLYEEYDWEARERDGEKVEEVGLMGRRGREEKGGEETKE